MTVIVGALGGLAWGYFTVWTFFNHGFVAAVPRGVIAGCALFLIVEVVSRLEYRL